MSRVTVDTADLAAVVQSLNDAAAVTREMQTRSRSSRSALGGCGHPGLAAAGEELLGRWAFGMNVLTEDTVWLAALLREAAVAYGHVERCVVAASAVEPPPAPARSR